MYRGGITILIMGSVNCCAWHWMLYMGKGLWANNTL